MLDSDLLLLAEFVEGFNIYVLVDLGARFTPVLRHDFDHPALTYPFKELITRLKRANDLQ